MSDADHAFLRNHIRDSTTGTSGSGWRQFQKFRKGFKINPQVASLPLIVKFIRNLYETSGMCPMLNPSLSAINKYHIVDLTTRKTVGNHPLVSTAKKAFWQLKPPIPKYHGTYRQNETLTLKQLSEKTVFLVVFSTLSRYWIALTQGPSQSPFSSIVSSLS